MYRQRRFVREQAAQDLIEYALLAAFLAVAVVAGMRIMTSSSARLTYIAQGIHESSPTTAVEQRVGTGHGRHALNER